MGFNQWQILPMRFLKLAAVVRFFAGGFHWCGCPDGGLHHLRGVDRCFPCQGQQQRRAEEVST